MEAAMSAETVTQATPNATDGDLITNSVTKGKPPTKQGKDNGRGDFITEDGPVKLEDFEHMVGDLFTELGKQVGTEQVSYYGTAVSTMAAAYATESPEDRAKAEGFTTPYTPLHITDQESEATKGELVVWGAAPRLRRRLVTNRGNGTGINIIIIGIVPTLCEGTLPARHQRRGNSSYGVFVMGVVMVSEIMSMMTIIKLMH